jgi:uncharacterized repeat protein (TIGR03803 family)
LQRRGPVAGLIADSAGNLYGTTLRGGVGCLGAGCGVVFELSPDGTETVLYSFTDGSDGGLPAACLIFDAGGALYGTTLGGGMVCDNFGNTCGTVYELPAPFSAFSGKLEISFGKKANTDSFQLNSSFTLASKRSIRPPSR